MTPSGRPLFWRAVGMAGVPPVVALPFWILQDDVSAWAGSLAFYEVVAAPILLALAAFTFFRRERWTAPATYLWALTRAALLGVSLWYLGLGLHRDDLFSPEPLTLELMGIALSVQLIAALVAVLVILGVQRLREREG